MSNAAMNNHAHEFLWQFSHLFSANSPFIMGKEIDFQVIRWGMFFFIRNNQRISKGISPFYSPNNKG
jgi:hypothetical protein